MVVKIQNEEPVQILAHSFIASPSEQEYVFAYSADGKHFTQYEKSTPIGENLNVFGLAFGSYVKFIGNQSEITVRY